MGAGKWFYMLIKTLAPGAHVKSTGSYGVHVSAFSQIPLVAHKSASSSTLGGINVECPGYPGVAWG